MTIGNVRQWYVTLRNGKSVVEPAGDAPPCCPPLRPSISREIMPSSFASRCSTVKMTTSIMHVRQWSSITSAAIIWAQTNAAVVTVAVTRSLHGRHTVVTRPIPDHYAPVPWMARACRVPAARLPRACSDVPLHTAVKWRTCSQMRQSSRGIVRGALLVSLREPSDEASSR